MEQPNNDERKNDIFEAKTHANEDAGNDNEYEDDNENDDELNFPPLSIVYPEYHRRYVQDALSVHIDFTMWMVWDDDAIDFNHDIWILLPSDIRARLILEGNSNMSD